MPSADERAFFDRIQDTPDDDAPRLIYADWLDEHAQPERAEFVRVQCALARLPADDPRRAELEERERSLADTHAAAWSASLLPYVSEPAFRRGVIDRVSVDTAKFLASGAAIFDLAPVRKVRFLHVGDQLTRLVQSPLLRLVREVDLSGNPVGNRGPTLLGKSPHLIRLDALDLGFTELGDKGLRALALSPVFDGLRSLQINDNIGIGVAGIRALVAGPHLNSLTDLDVSGNGLNVALAPLLQGPLADRLERLVLSGNLLAEAGTAALARSRVFARMAERDRGIDLRRVGMGPAGARALAESPALTCIETLDLEGNDLGDAGLIALADSPHLVNLRVLSVRENRISEDGVRALARSPLMKTLRDLDLTDNIVTQESLDVLTEASVKHNWRGLLQLKVNSLIRSRPYGVGPLGGFNRRLPS